MQNKHTGRKTNSSPASLANLRPFNKMSKEEMNAIREKGLKKAREVQAQKQAFRKAAEWVSGLPAFKTDNEHIEQLRKLYPELTNAQAMTAAVVGKALGEGDPKAYATIRDTSGEAPNVAANLSSSEPIQITIKTVE